MRFHSPAGNWGRTSMGFLFPSFDGPTRVSPYVYMPRRRRWWPLAAAFGAGIGCVILVLGPWKHLDNAAPATKNATQERQNPLSAREATAEPPRQAAAPVAPAGAEPETTPTPRARPAAANVPAPPKASDNKPAAAGRSTIKRSNGNAGSATPLRSTDATVFGTRYPSAVETLRRAAANQPTGMIQVDEEELPDGRRVPVYRRATIFDGSRAQ
jgi:hypothetical protein